MNKKAQDHTLAIFTLSSQMHRIFAEANESEAQYKLHGSNNSYDLEHINRRYALVNELKASIDKLKKK
jgi:hypothetical protein